MNNSKQLSSKMKMKEDGRLATKHNGELKCQITNEDKFQFRFFEVVVFTRL